MTGITKHQWDELKRLQDQYVNEFINSSTPYHTAFILRWRLESLGLRGEYLDQEVRQAVARKAAQPHPPIKLTWADQDLVNLLRQ